MTALRFVQVDAFADRAFAGDPAAVTPLDAWLDDATLRLGSVLGRAARPRSLLCVFGKPARRPYRLHRRR